MNHVYIVTYLMDGMHEHARVNADNRRAARRIFKESMGSRYTIVDIEEVL